MSQVFIEEGKDIRTCFGRFSVTDRVAKNGQIAGRIHLRIYILQFLFDAVNTFLGGQRIMQTDGAQMCTRGDQAVNLRSGTK